jgi:hypothetical protein
MTEEEKSKLGDPEVYLNMQIKLLQVHGSNIF